MQTASDAWPTEEKNLKEAENWVSLVFENQNVWILLDNALIDS
jgi:hypothetical protein